MRGSLSTRTELSFKNECYRTLYRSSDVAPIIVSNYSVSSTAQIQGYIKPRKRLELRAAYRYLVVEAEYGSGIEEVPFISKHRGFISVDWSTRNDWTVDVLSHFIGKMKLPFTSDNPETYQLNETSDAYVLLNLQATKKYDNGFSFFFGMENALNYQQPNPIVSADQPFSPYFDASMVWGPIFGRMGYGGVRYRINKSKNTKNE